MENSGKNSNGIVHPGGNVPKKSDTFRLLPKRWKLFVPFVWLTSDLLPLEAGGDFF